MLAGSLSPFTSQIMLFIKSETVLVSRKLSTILEVGKINFNVMSSILYSNSPFASEVNSNSFDCIFSKFTIRFNVF